MDVVRQDITQESTVIYPTNFSDEDGFLQNVRDTTSRYRQNIIGRSTKSLSRENKHAMVEIFNSIGLWSGQMGQILVPCASCYRTRSADPRFDRLWKVRPVLDLIQEKCIDTQLPPIDRQSHESHSGKVYRYPIATNQ